MDILRSLDKQKRVCWFYQICYILGRVMFHDPSGVVYHACCITLSFVGIYFVEGGTKRVAKQDVVTFCINIKYDHACTEFVSNPVIASEVLLHYQIGSSHNVLYISTNCDIVYKIVFF